MIPPIIHQTWKNERIPHRYRSFVDSWRTHHPGWEWRLWTDKDNLQFVSSQYPSLLDLYTSFPLNIQRVDFIRYLILRTHGGVYVDLDLECIRNVEPLLHSRDCIFSFEHADHAKQHGVPFIVSNAFMASTPGHQFFDTIISEVHAYNSKHLKADVMVLESTGPLMLTRLLRDLPVDESVCVLDSVHFFPLSLSAADQSRGYDLSALSSILSPDVYGIHWHDGTWWRGGCRSQFLKLFSLFRSFGSDR
jgi:mannosyltransferase OCH1-like enzyme